MEKRIVELQSSDKRNDNQQLHVVTSQRPVIIQASELTGLRYRGRP